MSGILEVAAGNVKNLPIGILR